MSIRFYAILAWAGDDSRISHIGRQFRQENADFQWTDLLILASVLTAIAVIIWLLSRYIEFRERPSFHNPKALFNELARSHGLDWKNRRLLWSLANTQKLTRPASLFIDRQCWEKDRLRLGALKEHEEQLQSLRKTLFGGGEPQQSD